LAQAGLPLPLGREQNFQIRTNFQASHCPACAKPLVLVAQLTKIAKKFDILLKKSTLSVTFFVSL
jgi:hypothetical protein